MLDIVKSPRLSLLLPPPPLLLGRSIPLRERSSLVALTWISVKSDRREESEKKIDVKSKTSMKS